ncbi:unnamed protein product, partial [Mesorhabditis belari]|uniref:Major facilitator superfamily (MFS) profile domain-containing protein n=1 Tax=Mesorhabditis belari TaxID=2138241 RepID=A0AAF3FPA4_9BILA
MTAIKNDEIWKSESKGEKQTNWRAIYIAGAMLVFSGINQSIFYMPVWPYTKSIAPETSVSALGWIISANSLGCLMANPIFGWWSQKSMKAAQPVTFAFTAAAVGNLLYGLLPILNSSSIIPAMLTARFLCGIGAGTLGVLRSFAATASAPKDRLQAIAISSAGLTAGLSVGPTIQLMFMPIGSVGWTFFGVPFNQYTTPGYFVCIICLICVIILHTIFEENYVGIISDDEKAQNPWLVIPKFDRIPVGILFFVWSCMCSVGAAVYSVASPLTMAMYGWSSDEAVSYNALLQTGSCATSGITYLFLAKTRYGKMDRRAQICLGMSTFIIYMLAVYPWFFYEGPLEFANANGIGFPTIVAPLNALFSEIVGPRKQSFLQGWLTFSGSTCQFLTPLFVLPLFEISGFRWVIKSNGFAENESTNWNTDEI